MEIFLENFFSLGPSRVLGRARLGLIEESLGIELACLEAEPAAAQNLEKILKIFWELVAFLATPAALQRRPERGQEPLAVRVCE